MNRDEDPPFFKIKSERMAYHDICDGNLFLLDPILSTIERWMCPVIHVILTTSGWERKNNKEQTQKTTLKKGSQKT
jgi:cytochrome c-type biogenesis protein CcmH/NrfF